MLESVLTGFGICGATVFAEPTITEVKKVVGLIHGACACNGGSAGQYHPR